MYRVIDIHKAVATSFITLKNEDSGSVIRCFDDSRLMSAINFEFLEVGKSYDCKIELFGEFTDKVDHEDYVTVNGDEPEVVIGTTRYIKVVDNNDCYYIDKWKLDAIDLTKDPYFWYSRMDLVQVNDIVHADLRRSFNELNEESFDTRGIAADDIPAKLEQAIQTRPLHEGETKLGRFAVYLYEGVKYFVKFGSDGQVDFFYPWTD
ncbi:MAG: hypothetical protein FWH40_07050 [Coriobacteriia bacterium]|nr:hypothetical protein [Coriobacteriia bacterium]